MVCEKMTTRWTFDYSNLGPKKQISGTTFYKVSVGKETRWLSMEGIRMLQKAKEAGVNQKAVLGQVKHFTARGTATRLNRIRLNISQQLASLMNIEDMDRVRKGIANMTKLTGNQRLLSEMTATLQTMNEAELRYFWRHNRNLLEEFFTDSDKLKGTPATAAEQDTALVEKNIERNARKLQDKMLEIISRRGTPQQIR